MSSIRPILAALTSLLLCVAPAPAQTDGGDPYASDGGFPDHIYMSRERFDREYRLHQEWQLLNGRDGTGPTRAELWERQRRFDEARWIDHLSSQADLFQGYTDPTPQAYDPWEAAGYGDPASQVTPSGGDLLRGALDIGGSSTTDTWVPSASAGGLLGDLDLGAPVEPVSGDLSGAAPAEGLMTDGY